MKKLLLHACCAPCSSGIVPQLEDYDITLLFYNPNIDTLEEYNRRLETLKDYVYKYNKEYNKDIKYIAIPYNSKVVFIACRLYIANSTACTFFSQNK